MNKNRLKTIISVLALLSLLSCNNTSTQGRFSPLFNGKNLDGWYLKLRNGDAEMAKKVYAVENEMIHVFNDQFPDTIDLSTGENGTHGLFYTNKEYSKYILRFEYKWGTKIANNFDQWQYDAGCYYHVVNDKIWPTGLEYQIRYDHVKNQNHTGDFWACGPIQWFVGPDGKSFEQPKNGGVASPDRKGELFGLQSAPYNALNKQWNQCEVIAMADKYVIHKLNGKIVNMATDLAFRKGKIGFQSETAEIFYRNITIKEFDEVIPMDKFLE